MYIDELTHSVSTLNRIGSRSAEAFARMGVVSHGDLLFHIPRRYIDRTQPRLLSESEQGDVNTVATVRAHGYMGFGAKRTLKVIVEDESGFGSLVCFGRNFLTDSLPVGSKIYVAGHFQRYRGEIQSSNFDFAPFGVAIPPLFNSVLPVYPLAKPLNQTIARSAIKQLLSMYRIDDEIPRALAPSDNIAPLEQALRMCHAPKTMEETERARISLAWREMILFQLPLALNRQTNRAAPAPPKRRSLIAPCIERLPYRLTDDQRRSLREIAKDMEARQPMNRLLQGEVGSGKTLVALLAILLCLERNQQAVFMAPTDLLAHQHATRAKELFASLPITVELLTGSVRRPRRASILEEAQRGDIDLLIGTHALLGEHTQFSSLGLIVIDEQQRFGVEQRDQLIRKGENPDLLLTTATPIPRTLALAFLGDLQISAIRTMPPGRLPIINHIKQYGRERQVYERARKHIEDGSQCYLVYPIIEQGANKDRRSAEEMYRELGEGIFAPFRLALIHSRIKEQEKLEIMDKFSAGEIDALIATSVIEVGVDVANANVMIIEHAELFGLSALHQIRGRIGRGSRQAYCYFIYDPELTDIAKERLRAIHKENDGFAVAEIDLRLRGAGGLMGSRQSGAPDFRFVQLPLDIELLQQARKVSLELAERDSALSEPDHIALRRVVIARAAH